MTPIYRYFLQIDDGQRVECYPVFKDDMSLAYERAGGQMYHRAKLSGKLSFIADDFTTITSAPFDATIHIDIEMSRDRGLSWLAYHRGKFSITDCTVNYDDERVDVQPDYDDRYSDLLDGWEREYNLIKLAPELAPVLMHKRPMIQFYMLGSGKVTNVLRGMSWEVDVQGEETVANVQENCHFGINASYIEFYVTEAGNADGTFANAVFYSDGGQFSVRANNQARDYYIQCSYITSGTPVKTLTIALTRASDNVVISSGWEAITDTRPSSGTIALKDADGYDAGVAEYRLKDTFARIVCDVDEINGQQTFAIPSDDLVADNRNYRRCLPFETMVLRASPNWQDEPTEWGVRPDDTYYLPANFLYNPCPVFQGQWIYASVWFDYALFPAELDAGGRAAYVLKDASPIASVISVLLAQVAPNVTHMATPEYSEFLYGDTNPVSGDTWRLLMTQKSNVLAGNYTQAAQRGEITLKTVLDALKSIFNCYWFIDNQLRLRVEHVRWFRNGGSYVHDARVVGLDYTATEVTRNCKPWAYATNEVTYDKQLMPERYEFGWMDDVTEPFDGMPIVVDSKRMQRDKVEEINVSDITTDVDYMLLSPSECSMDGFAMLACVTTDGIAGDGATSGNNGHCFPLLLLAGVYYGRTATLTATASGGGIAQVYFYDSDRTIIYQRGRPYFTADGAEHSVEVTIPANAYYIGYFANGAVSVQSSTLDVADVYECPFVTIPLGDGTVSAQNGYLAFSDLQPKYWLDDLPAPAVTVNGQAAVARSVMMSKRQRITAPAGEEDPDPNALVRTGIGDGEIMTMQINLQSRAAQFTLAHEQ